MNQTNEKTTPQVVIVMDSIFNLPAMPLHQENLLFERLKVLILHNIMMRSIIDIKAFCQEVSGTKGLTEGGNTRIDRFKLFSVSPQNTGKDYCLGIAACCELGYVMI